MTGIVKSAEAFLEKNRGHGLSDTTCTYIAGLLDEIERLRKEAYDAHLLMTMQDQQIEHFKKCGEILGQKFEDHYWDTFQKDRELILSHIKAVFKSIYEQKATENVK